MKMLCGYCGEMKEYPRDFPVLHYAKCINCYEKEEREKKVPLKERINKFILGEYYARYVGEEPKMEVCDIEEKK